MMEETSKKSIEPMDSRKSKFEKFWFIPLILAAILLILVGYLWMTNRKFLSSKKSTLFVTSTPTPTITAVEEVNNGETSNSNLKFQQESDEISIIETDIKNTDLSDVDKEISDIENELNTP